MVAEGMAAVAVGLMEAGVVAVMVAEVVAVALDEAGVGLLAGDVELEMCVALHCCCCAYVDAQHSATHSTTRCIWSVVIGLGA